MSFDLRQFLPYRLSVITNAVSTNLSNQYAQQYKLTINEWRVMAALGMDSPVSAEQIVQITRLDKVSVSRAISSLTAAGRVLRSIDSTDRRRSSLKLSAEGGRIYEKIVPLATEYERDLLAGLNAKERAQLDELLGRLSARADELSHENQNERTEDQAQNERRTA